jgi:hypothetical protein
MTEETHPLATLTDEGLDALLRRAIRNALILGLVASLAISAASIMEWQRLVRIMNARLDKKQAPRGAAMVAVFFVLRLTVFAGAIYVSLKCFRGSIVALLCGLGLAVLAMLWEAIRLLRD